MQNFAFVWGDVKGSHTTRCKTGGSFETAAADSGDTLWLILIKIKSQIEKLRKACTRLCRLNIHGQISHNQTGFLRFPS